MSSLGITNLAKETSSLQYKRDVTGATCINQYVVIKALGRGSFGKVKLCLNTFDGRMYAVKVSTVGAFLNPSPEALLWQSPCTKHNPERL